MIDKTTIWAHDERYAPPEQAVLQVGLVGDVVYLAIGKYSETSEGNSFTVIEQVAVPVCDLLNAVNSAAVSNLRRAAAKDGGDSNLTYVP